MTSSASRCVGRWTARTRGFAAGLGFPPGKVSRGKRTKNNAKARPIQRTGLQTFVGRLVLVVEARFWVRFPRLRDDITALVLEMSTCYGKADDFRSPPARGSLPTWLLLLPLAIVAGETGRRSWAGPASRQGAGADADRGAGRGRRIAVAVAGVSVAGGDRGLSCGAGWVADRSVAYTVCSLESDQARGGLWLQVG
jgi:hypothetical protein